LLSHLDQAQQQLYLYDLETDTVRRLEHPAGMLGGWRDRGIITENGEILITWQDVAHPCRLIALDAATGRQVRTVLGSDEVPAGRTWESITFSSENGAAIHGWLALPNGSGPFPTILHTHGGPTTVMTWGLPTAASISTVLPRLARTFRNRSLAGSANWK
jgi:dipeptidyl aminopeptidase/acylaminoacyl peptidase